MSGADELLQNNARYAEKFIKGDLPSPPARGVTVVACMDAHLDTDTLHGAEARVRPQVLQRLRHAWADSGGDSAPYQQDPDRAVPASSDPAFAKRASTVDASLAANSFALNMATVIPRPGVDARSNFYDAPGGLLL